MVAGVVALVTLAWQIAQSVAAGDVPPADRTTTGATTPPPDPTTAPPPPATPTPTPPPEPSEQPDRSTEAAVRWEGEVYVQRGGVDLDAVPAMVREAGADIRKDDFTEIAPGEGAAVLTWPGPGRPGYQECAAHVQAPSDIPVLDPEKGSYLCVRTNEGRIAVIRYLHIVNGGAFGFDVTSWQDH
ncbi:hypothetical protein [Sphaerisporangium aureirubrum]|uniref:Serine/threonine protein kinase n=1 Tax=Sphaerisporangium aureirubrum TaxID=1544736 RepID=A0ABW1NWI0_9ACTN